MGLENDDSFILFSFFEDIVRLYLQRMQIPFAFKITDHISQTKNPRDTSSLSQSMGDSEVGDSNGICPKTRMMAAAASDASPAYSHQGFF